MRHEINIYGDIVPFKWLNDGSEYDLKDLRDSLNSLDIKEGEELTVNIHTFGGDTTTAFAMYNLLKRFKKENNISIRTRVDGYCASSGVIILLAGDKDKRVGSKYLKPFVHNAWSWMLSGDKKEAKKIFEELDIVDNEIAELYSEETTITKELGLQFMNESRDLTVEECITYGFYTELENVHIVENSLIFNSIISRNQQNRKINQNNMSDKNKQSAWNKLVKDAEAFFKGTSTKNKIVFTADNSELDFYELNDDDTPKAKTGDTPGDKAKFDGKPAGETNNGEYVMPSGETYKFDGEELVEIIAKTEDKADDLQAENQKLTEEIQNLKTKIQNLESTNKEKDSKITTLNNQLAQSKTLIKNFQNLGNAFDEEEEEDKREPKPKPEDKGKSRVSNALSKFKKEK
ncbi:ATP-dependent Clp protease proteolytic subunit [Chryseobacterium daeguense]|uniref:ATP-dependent Clp protease proteolytic subunit n=1 Tax=Chryseobacterium daeguense TaxID=412438 RepID=UPI00040BB7CE|nr:ATP-dependent Clp protease proteolytic subunit [Chryseobacterium daeguense]